MKNGNSISFPVEFASLRREVQIAQRIAVAARPSAMPPRPHHQGFGACGPLASTARKSFSGPERSSASNHPPTNITAGVMFFICGASARGLPELVVIVVRQQMSFQYAFSFFRYFSLPFASGPMCR